MKCSVCNEEGHRPANCPELSKDLEEGFYQGTRLPPDEDED